MRKDLPEVVESPCNGVCRIVERTGFCAGCGRTLDEIARWSSESDAWKARVLEALPERPKDGS